MVAEVVEKVQQAAKVLQENKDAALTEFLNPDGSWTPNNKWVWKDTDVFVYDCNADKALAHPLLMGGTVMDIKDKNGKFVIKELCQAGERKGGGWVSYLWPKSDGSVLAAKISFALAVVGTSWQVSAGIYSKEKVVVDYELREKK